MTDLTQVLGDAGIRFRRGNVRDHDHGRLMIFEAVGAEVIGDDEE